MKECAFTFVIDYATGIFLSASIILFYLSQQSLKLTIIVNFPSPLLQINKRFQRGCHFPKIAYWQKAKFGFSLRSYSKNSVFSLTEFYIDTKLENVAGASKYGMEYPHGFVLHL